MGHKVNNADKVHNFILRRISLNLLLLLVFSSTSISARGLFCLAGLTNVQHVNTEGAFVPNCGRLKQTPMVYNDDRRHTTHHSSYVTELQCNYDNQYLSITHNVITTTNTCPSSVSPAATSYVGTVVMETDYLHRQQTNKRCY